LILPFDPDYRADNGTRPVHLSSNIEALREQLKGSTEEEKKRLDGGRSPRA
jgi:hypothetical protein